MDNTNKALQIVVFELDKEAYAVPVTDVLEVMKMPDITPVPDSTPAILGFINLRGKIIPILSLDVRFHLKRHHDEVGMKHVMIVDANDAPFGILVDTVIEVARIEQSMIQPAPAEIQHAIDTHFIHGVVIRQQEEQKQAILLLNLKQLLNADEKQDVQIIHAQGGAI